MNDRYKLLTDSKGDVYAKFTNYNVYRDGRVYNRETGNWLKAGDNNRIILYINHSDKKSISLAKLIYHIFIDNNVNYIDKNWAIIFKDGNKDNFSEDNLLLIKEEQVKEIARKNAVECKTVNHIITIENADINKNLILYDESGNPCVLFGDYRIYPSGRVYSMLSQKDILGCMICGVRCVDLFINNKKQRFSLKTLVAHFFICKDIKVKNRNSSNIRAICIDGDEKNVSVDNIKVEFYKYKKLKGDDKKV